MVCQGDRNSGSSPSIGSASCLAFVYFQSAFYLIAMSDLQMPSGSCSLCWQKASSLAQPSAVRICSIAIICCLRVQFSRASFRFSSAVSWLSSLLSTTLVENESSSNLLGLKIGLSNLSLGKTKFCRMSRSRFSLAGSLFSIQIIKSLSLLPLVRQPLRLAFLAVITVLLLLAGLDRPTDGLLLDGGDVHLEFLGVMNPL